VVANVTFPAAQQTQRCSGSAERRRVNYRQSLAALWATANQA
jgi:hypothetical protein